MRNSNMKNHAFGGKAAPTGRCRGRVGCAAAALFVAASILVPNLGTGGGCGTTPIGAVAAGGGNPAALQGVWRAQFVDPTFGAGTIELILQNNGNFSQETNYALGARIYIYGTWRVLPDAAVLRLDTQGGVPTEQCSTVGCSPILYPGETHNYTLSNNNATLTTHNINCAADQCTYVYGKAI